MITLLTKRARDGKLYTRVPEIEARLIQLAALSRDEILGQCTIKRRDDPNYVPSECLLYFVRASRADNSDTHFEQLYKILVERVSRSLPRAESSDGQSLSLTNSSIREKVFDRFTELLADDRKTQSEKLDFFEVRFDGALASLRRDAREQAWRHENRSVSLELDEDTGEPSAEVEQATGRFNPFVSNETNTADYRFRVDAAIDALPPLQRRIVEMCGQGFPIDSKDPDTITIAKTLRKSEKTIRTHRDKAYASLRAALMPGDK